MERVIVTVKKDQEARVRDLDVPAGIEATRLAEVIASALRWDKDSAGGMVSYQIEAHPPGRVLRATETLTAAGVGNGAWLTFIPEGSSTTSVASQDPVAIPRDRSSPIKRWLPLDIDLPSSDSASDDDNGDSDTLSSSPYVWKEIDF